MTPTASSHRHRGGDSHITTTPTANPNAAHNIAAALAVALLICRTPPLAAQITLDGTVGPPGPLPGPNFLIPAAVGQTQGPNLLHSFADFNIAPGQSATFAGPTTIQNIIARVTGGTASNIQGTIASTIDGANLFLINPYGIVFGPGAQLDLSGDFTATTAHTIDLADGGLIDARTPANTVLTSAHPTAFGFLPTASTTTAAPITVDQASLALTDDHSLTLIGGDTDIAGNSSFLDIVLINESALLRTEAGRLHIVAVASPGTVTLNTTAPPDTDSFSALGDVHIRDGALVRTDGSNPLMSTGPDKANLTIVADRLRVSQAIIHTFGGNAPDTGAIYITADHIELTNQAGVFTGPGFGGTGTRTAPINIHATRLQVTDDAKIRSTGENPGASDINITADQIHIERSYSAVFSSVSSGSQPGGDINIDAHLLAIDDIAGIETDTFGTPPGGNINIAADTINLSNHAKIGTNSTSNGAGGGISINATTLLLDADSSVTANTLNIGDAGPIDITATDIGLAQGAQILSTTSGAGRGADITVFTDALELDSDSALRLQTTGPADAGDILVFANHINIADHAAITAHSLDSTGGSLGRIDILTNSLSITGVSGAMMGDPTTGITATSGDGRGAPGHITVTTTQLTLTDGANLGSRVFGTDPGAPIDILADDITLTDGGRIATNTHAQGNAGDITINTTTLTTARAGAFINFQNNGTSGVISQTNPDATGRAGGISISATDIDIATGGIIAIDTFSTANASDIEINTATLSLTGTDLALAKILDALGVEIALSASAAIFTRSTGVPLAKAASGNAGQIIINADHIHLADSALIATATTTPGEGGSIDITTDRLHITNEASIFTRSIRSTAAVPADINAHANQSITIDRGGRVSVAADNSVGGNIDLSSGSTIILDNATITAQAAVDGGNIRLTAPHLIQATNSDITAGAVFNGGNVTIDPVFVILNNSLIAANAVFGTGGVITIIADALIISADTEISASSQFGVAGTIHTTPPDTDLAATLARLADDLADSRANLSQRCAELSAPAASSFVITGLGGQPDQPGPNAPAYHLRSREPAQPDAHNP